MKKRFISFVLVFIFIFSGVFSCIASADSVAVSKYFDLYKKYIQSLGQFAWDQSFFGDLEDLMYLLDEQQDAIEEQQDDDTSCKIYYAYQQKWYGIDVYGYSSQHNTLKNCAYFAIIENYPNNSYSDRSNLGSAYVVAVPNEYAHNVSFSFDGQYYRLICSDSIVYYQYTLKLQLDSHDNPVTYLYNNSITTRNAGNGQFYLNNITVNSATYVGKRLGLNDFDRTKIEFYGSSSETPNIINLYLVTSRDIVESVDGTYMIGFGILYDNGTDRMYCGKYVDFRQVASGSEWQASFNLKDFANYVYRKRCPLTDYKAFIFSYQNGFVFDMEFPIELDQPDGIFDDTEPSPDWRDYEPEPFYPPDPPDFDTNIFNFNFNTNNYVTYNFQNVQNFTYSGGGSGGSGGGGGGGGTGTDDSSIPDDSSSSSSGGDSSVNDSGSGGGVNINPEIDFDFGLLTAFLDWFAGAFGTLLSNLTGFFGAMLANFELLLDRLFTFFNDFSAYLSGTFNDWLQYFFDIIVGISNYFMTWGNSFAEYIGDCINNFDFNTRIMISNLKQYFDTQFIPDSDNVNFILSDCLGWYYQIQQLLASKSYSSTVFTLGLGDLGTFTLNDPQLFSQVRSLIGIIVMGCTAIKCLCLGFQMFGINIGGGDSDDS